jgi:hypothetical protein
MLPVPRSIALLAMLAAVVPAIGQSPKIPANSVVSARYGYADMADMLIAAPIVAIVQIDGTIPLAGPQAAGVRPGFARLYVTASVVTLVRGAEGLAPKIAYLADVPLDGANRAPKLKKQRFIVLGRAGRPGELTLIGPHAHIPWTPQDEAWTRGILGETLAPGAVPAITGIGGAFHVPGSLPGESETQIFLKTADARPISLSILRRPGEQPRWAVSLTEMVDNSAAPPQRDTFLWYRLACGLPRQLPPAVLASLSPEDQAGARQDYQLVLEGLGRCGRT